MTVSATGGLYVVWDAILDVRYQHFKAIRETINVGVKHAGSMGYSVGDFVNSSHSYRA